MNLGAHAWVAQLVELPARNGAVGGSTPPPGSHPNVQGVVADLQDGRRRLTAQAGGHRDPLPEWRGGDSQECRGPRQPGFARRSEAVRSRRLPQAWPRERCSPETEHGWAGSTPAWGAAVRLEVPIRRILGVSEGAKSPSQCKAGTLSPKADGLAVPVASCHPDQHAPARGRVGPGSDRCSATTNAEPVRCRHLPLVTESRASAWLKPRRPRFDSWLGDHRREVRHAIGSPVTALRCRSKRSVDQCWMVPRPHPPGGAAIGGAA